MLFALLGRVQDYRLFFLASFLVANGLCMWWATYLPFIQDSQAQVPDAILTGATPAQVHHWYQQLDGGQLFMAVLFGIVDLVGIIPSYTLWLGTELRHRPRIPAMACGIPFLGACCDVMESATHLLANLSRLWRSAVSIVPEGGNATVVRAGVWTPSTRWLAIVAMATIGKVLAIVLSILIIAMDAAMNKFGSDSSKQHEKLTGKKKS